MVLAKPLNNSKGVYPMSFPKYFLYVLAILAASNGAFAGSGVENEFESLRFKGSCQILGQPNAVLADFTLDPVESRLLELQAKEVDTKGNTVVTAVTILFRAFDELTLQFLTEVPNSNRDLGRAAINGVAVGNQLNADLPLALGGTVHCSGRVSTVQQQ